MRSYGLPLFKDVDVDDVDGRDAIDAGGDGFMLSVDVPCVSCVLDVALTLVETLCCACAFAKAEPEGSRRNSDPKRPLMPLFFLSSIGVSFCPAVSRGRVFWLRDMTTNFVYVSIRQSEDFT